MYAAGMYGIYLKSVPRYKFLILGTYHPDAIFMWARMWGSVFIFQSQVGFMNKNVWETLVAS